MKEEEIPSPPRANDPTPEPPPAGTRWMAVLRWALLCVLVAFAAGAILWFFRVGPFGEIQREGDALYQCPMHPEIVQDRPGSCPICGMDLVPVEGAAQKPPTAYTCPMHPEIVQDHPGRCPICGMDLVPVSPEPQHASADQPARSLLPGHSEVHLDSRRVQMIGLRTAPVERRTLSGEIRTVAVATADESRLSMVHTKVPGWIDRLPVSRVGEYVRKGQVVARLHSLELVAAQEDFLAALRNAQTLKETAGGDAKRVLQAARNRLALWGMSDREIDLLAATGEVRRSVEILSQASGYVLSLGVLEGHQVEPGTTLMTIADLSQVWAVLDLYEFDIGRVRTGDAVEIEWAGLSGETYHSTVDYVYPLVDARTRTTKARAVLANPGGRIRPGMYGRARIAVEPRQSLVVPVEALIDTGTEQYVFVLEGPGHFVPVRVQAGLTTPAEVEILSGLAEGQQVVTSGNFLLDSESRMLGAAARARAGGAVPATEKPESGPGGHGVH